MKRTINSILLFIIIFLSYASCQKEENDVKSSDQYVFIEQLTVEHGELISGPQPPLIQIDFPTFSFNSETKELKGIIDFEISKELKLIYGSGSCLSGTAGGGCGTGLNGVYVIPFERAKFELLKIDLDGSIIAVYNDDVIDLPAGQEWKKETVRLDTTIVDGLKSISEITQTITINNYGLLKKSDIISWDW